MVFRKESAPITKKDFMDWYYKQTDWPEEHGYNNPEITSSELKNWYLEMLMTFPSLNNIESDDEVDNPKITEYCIGRDVIYVTFGWSQADLAYKLVKELALKHNVGFFDASGNNDILIPNGNECFKTLDSEQKLSNSWWKFWQH